MKTRKTFISLALALFMLIALLPSQAFASEGSRYLGGSPYPSVQSANVYYNKVNGYATPYSLVQLYRDGSLLSGVRADKNGFYEISHTFAYGDYYRGNYEIYPNVSYSSTSGYTRANTYVVAYDGRGNLLDSTYSDSNGYFSLRYSYVSNPSAIRVFAGYYDGAYNGYRYLDSYKLEASIDGYTSGAFYLSNGNIRDYDYKWPVKPADPVVSESPALISSAAAGSAFVSGHNLSSQAKVTITDIYGVQLGTGNADDNGLFTIYLSRALKSGETIKLISYGQGQGPAYKSLIVEGVKKPANSTIFTLDLAQYTLRKNGVASTYYMDVAPYGKDGRTMLPLRYVAEALGYNVTYNNAMHMATFSNGNSTILVDVFSDVFYIDGVRHVFEVKPEIKSERTMLPIAEIGKALGLSHGILGEGKNIEWDSVNRQVIISVK